jgi:hypothetical protein
MNTERGFKRILTIAVSETGSGAVILLDNGVVHANKERLRLDGHHDEELVRIGKIRS